MADDMMHANHYADLRCLIKRGQNIEAGWIEYSVHAAPPGLSEKDLQCPHCVFRRRAFHVA